jgi:hypothetical protein
MAGKLVRIDTPTAPPLRLREAEAYCEGRRAAADGGLVGDNPHTVLNPPLAPHWEAGFDSWTADPAGLNTKDFCALRYGGGYVPPEG